MENTDSNLNLQARAYFLEQGQSIGKLYGSLVSWAVGYHLKKWLSLILEVGFYLLFALIIILAVTFPSELITEIPLDDHNGLKLGLRNDNVEAMILAIKLVIVFLSLPNLIIALLLGRNRRKSKRIRIAFEETEKMKKGFDEAVKGLKI